MDALVTKYSFWCYVITIGAIVLLYSVAAVLAYAGKPSESLGIGGAGTGLIGLAGTFKPTSRASMNTVQNASNVNQGPNANAPPQDPTA